MRAFSVVCLLMTLASCVLAATFLESLSTWNSARSACKTDACRTAADNAFRDDVNAAVAANTISTVENCASGWGSFEYAQADGSYVEARLPC